MALFYAELKGVKEQQKSFVELTDWLNDLSPFWRDVFAPKYFAAIQDLFKTSGTPRGEGGKFSGAPWERLSPNYAAWKYKVYPGQPILTATSRLRNSLMWGGTNLGPEGYWMVTPKSVEFGTMVPYAAALHRGSHKKNIPPRPFLLQPDPAVFGPLLKNWILWNSNKGGVPPGAPGMAG